MKTIFVEIPYFDEDGMKQRIQLTLNADIDKRAMYKGIRQMVKEMFNKTIGKEWIKQHCTIAHDRNHVRITEDIATTQKELDKLYLQIMAETEAEELTNDSNSIQQETVSI